MDETTKSSRVANLGLLPFIKTSKDYEGVTLKALRVLDFVDDYDKALQSGNDLSRKCALKSILYECRNGDYNDVAEYISKKFIGKDYISLCHLEMHKQL